MIGGLMTKRMAHVTINMNLGTNIINRYFNNRCGTDSLENGYFRTNFTRGLNRIQ